MKSCSTAETTKTQGWEHTLTLQNTVMYHIIPQNVGYQRNIEKNCCMTHPSTSPEQVFCSGSHAHLLVDLLVDPSSPVL